MKALVLSGGGAKGAYQVGALLYIMGVLGKRYDIYCGISVGALNCSFLSMYPKGEELQAINDLKALWDTVDDRRIFKNRYPFGTALSMALSMLGNKSLYNSSPLINLVRKELHADKIVASNRILSIGAVSIHSGSYRSWREDSPDIVEAVLASSSFPLFFNPISIDGELWTDGGIREITPIEEALALGATEVDVINLDSGLMPFPAHERNLVTLGPRFLDIMATEVGNDDFSVIEDSEATIRVLRPSKPLLHNSLDFDPKKIAKNIDLGYEAAKAIEW